MDRHRKPPAGAVGIGIADKFDKSKREKQRCKEIKGAVLIAGNEIIGTRSLSWQLKADFAIRSDFLN